MWSELNFKKLLNYEKPFKWPSLGQPSGPTRASFSLSLSSFSLSHDLYSASAHFSAWPPETTLATIKPPLSQPVSTSPSPRSAFSLFLAHSFSLLLTDRGGYDDWGQQQWYGPLAQEGWLQRQSRWGEAAPQQPNRRLGSSGLLMGKPWFPGIASPSFVTFTTVSRSQQVSLGLLIKMVPSVPEESTWIVGTYFHAKMANFADWSEPNGALFWGNALKFILVVKKVFPTVYNMPMFEVVCKKKSHFSRQSVIW